MKNRVYSKYSTDQLLLDDMLSGISFEQVSAAVKAENLTSPKKRDVIFQRVIRVDGHEEAARAGSEP